ncbi:hypothetical protein [Streptomyces virginiae]|uniref:hypothetical protein n=1 Tax=Streptomyces virginiae TaxID=1961 RepID=UPI0036FA5E91
MIVLLFGSIAAMMAALFLLVVGPLFAALWVIPGRPRQWGVRWADALVGVVMQSAITTLTAGSVMIIQMVTALAMPTYGWLGCSALSIAGAISAFKYRSILTGIVGGAGPTGGSGAGALLGALATRSPSRHADRVLRTPGRISRRLGDAVERRHRPPVQPRPGLPRPPAPPPPPPPAGGRPPRPGSGTGPGRGTGPGGTGPGTTLAAAGRRTARTNSAGAQRGQGQQTPVRSSTARTVTVPPPSGQGQGQQTPVHSPTARTIPAPTTPANQQLPGGPMRMPTTAGTTPNRPQKARKATQPPAPSAGSRRAQTPPPRTPRLRTGPPRPPAPAPRMDTAAPAPTAPAHLKGGVTAHGQAPPRPCP